MCALRNYNDLSQTIRSSLREGSLEWNQRMGVGANSNRIPYLGKFFLRNLAARNLRTPRELATYFKREIGRLPRDNGRLFPRVRRHEIRRLVQEICQNKQASRCSATRGHENYFVRDVNPGCIAGISALLDNSVRADVGIFEPIANNRCPNNIACFNAADARSVGQVLENAQSKVPSRRGVGGYRAATCACLDLETCAQTHGCVPLPGRNANGNPLPYAFANPDRDARNTTAAVCGPVRGVGFEGILRPGIESAAYAGQKTEAGNGEFARPLAKYGGIQGQRARWRARRNSPLPDV